MPGNRGLRRGVSAADLSQDAAPNNESQLTDSMEVNLSQPDPVVNDGLDDESQQQVQPTLDENPESESDEDDDEIPAFYQMHFMSDGSVHSTGGMPSPGALQIAGMLQHFLASRAAESENPPPFIHGPAGAVAVASSGNGDGGYTNEGAKSNIDGDSMMQPKKKKGKANKKKGKAFGSKKQKKF